MFQTFVPFKKYQTRHEPTPSMDTTILRRRRVYCPHHRFPRCFQQSIPTTLAALSFSTSLTMLDFSLPRHPLYQQLPIRPSPTYIPGLSCPTSVLLQTFSFLLLLPFYPRSFYILSLFLSLSLSTLIRHDVLVRIVSPTLFLSFLFVSLLLTQFVLNCSFLSRG